jgi:hypothetical protein
MAATRPLPPIEDLPKDLTPTRLSDFRKQAGVSSSTLWIWERAGKIHVRRVGRAAFVPYSFSELLRIVEG